MRTTMHVRRWLMSLVLAAIALLPLPVAACINATMASDEGISKLRRAEAALDKGDVLTARELAEEVRHATMVQAHGSNGDLALHERASRVEALSHVRDPRATPEELADAADLLDGTIQMIESLQGLRTVSASPSPALLADDGEALERVGKDVEALRRLVPLADADLVGSAYAYAALSRAAKRSGDDARAATAMARCTTMAIDPKMCAGSYPPRPLLRGRPVDYALPGACFALALLLAHLRRRRGLPWATFRGRTFALGVVAVAALTFAATPDLKRSMFCAIVGLGMLPFLQRRGFFGAVRRGRVPGFHLRPTEPLDATAPLLRLALLPGHAETLERQNDPAYRETARTPLYRLERRPLRLAWIALAAGLAMFAGCALALARAM